MFQVLNLEKNMDKNILVLGSNSPSGAAFCKQAALAGHTVIASSRSEEANSVYLPYKWVEHKRIKFYQLDLNHDISKIDKIAKKYKINTVVNFASQSMVGQSWQHPEHWMQTNVVSTVSLLEALRNLESLDKYIHFSTPEVYGSTDGWVKESRQFNPSTPYASSRAAGDMNVKLWADTYDMPCIITRAANIYGAGQQLYRIIPKTVLSCLLGRKLPLHGGGGSERAFVHINDVADGLLLILDSNFKNDTFHISPHDKISIKCLVEKICNMCHREMKDVVEITSDRVGKDQAYLLDSSKIQRSLGWQAKISLNEGLNEVIDWCERNIELLKHQNTNYVHRK